MVREKMIQLMDSLLLVVDRIAKDEDAFPEEIALLPELADAIVKITEYVAIEKKD